MSDNDMPEPIDVSEDLKLRAVGFVRAVAAMVASHEPDSPFLPTELYDAVEWVVEPLAAVLTPDTYPVDALSALTERITAVVLAGAMLSAD